MTLVKTLLAVTAQALFRPRQAIILALMAVSFGSLRADELSGTVVGVADGDTLTIIDSARQQHKIRLAGIDAPEKKQPFGKVSRQHLADLCFQQSVRVEWNKRDRYRRIIGKVYCNREDAGLRQIQAGLAWWYRKYSNEQLSADRERYAHAEQTARHNRIGLWRDPTPIEPWVWRKR